MTKQVVIRMYNVGFGDAFLVRVPAANGKTLKILVDCGSIAAADKSLPIGAVVKAIIDDVKDGGGSAKIDLVIATHRHRDHVSGFADPAWADVEVREVWMPWTENPRDPVAVKIRDQQASLAMNLAAGFAPRTAAEIAADGWTNEAHQMALNALSNEAAMATLHTGFAGEPVRRFLPVRDAKYTNQDNSAVSPIRIDGVTFHIAGPGFSEDVIRDMDPPAGHSYLAMLDGAVPGIVVPPALFPDFWSISPTPEPLTAVERERLDASSEDLSASALASLESAVNGTSLFIIMQVAGVNFVFPGDAQWGTWKAVLADPTYRAMLRSTRFYKVGHHGSHNATPTDFVEQLDEKIVAMASVHPVQRWPGVPKTELLAALEGHGALARSDQATTTGPFTVGSKRLYVETAISLGAAPAGAPEVPSPIARTLESMGPTLQLAQPHAHARVVVEAAGTATGTSTAIAFAAKFVEEVPVPFAPPRFGVERATTETTKPMEDVDLVGGDLVSFSPDLDFPARKDVVNASLLAQLVAKRRMSTPLTLADWSTWYATYFDALSHLGFAVESDTTSTYRTKGDTFDVSEEVLTLANEIVGVIPGALDLVKKALTVLKSVTSEKILTAFDREARSANTARFQVSVAAPRPDGRIVMSPMAFGMEANARVTQVLFFKFRTSDIKIERFGSVLAIDPAILSSLREPIEARVAAFAKDYIHALTPLAGV